MNRNLFKAIQESRHPKNLSLCYLWTNGIGYVNMRTYPCNKWGIGYWRRRVEQKQHNGRDLLAKLEAKEYGDS